MNDKIAIYLRLSLADGDLKKGSKDESNSIENQRMLLHDYIGKQEDLFGEIVEYLKHPNERFLRYTDAT